MVAAVWCLITCLFFILLGLPAVALERLDDSDLDGIHGQSGIALALSDVRIYQHKSRMAYRDTSEAGNMIALEGILYSDGNNRPMRFHTPQPVTLRAFQNPDGRPLVGFEAPHWEQDVAIDTAALIFCDRNLGSIHLSGFSPNRFALYATPLDTGGLGFQFETYAENDEFRWQYNETGEPEENAALFRGFHLAGSFAEGATPTDPSTWQPEGSFMVGHVNPYGGGHYQPGEFRVMQDQEGRGFIQMQMPMTGSIRMEEVKMGGHDMGPIIIDGMRVHELTVEFIPY